MRKAALFDPGTDLSKQERARRRRRGIEREQASSQAWRQTWQPLPPSQPRVVRSGAMDFMRLPSLIGTRKD